MNQVDTLHVGRIKFYAVPSLLTLRLSFGIFKVYFLNLLMNQVYTWHVGRHWPEVLCCTIMTHLSGLEVKVTDFEILFERFCLKC